MTAFLFVLCAYFIAIESARDPPGRHAGAFDVTVSNKPSLTFHHVDVLFTASGILDASTLMKSVSDPLVPLVIEKLGRPIFIKDTRTDTWNKFYLNEWNPTTKILEFLPSADEGAVNTFTVSELKSKIEQHEVALFGSPTADVAVSKKNPVLPSVYAIKPAQQPATDYSQDAKSDPNFFKSVGEPIMNIQYRYSEKLGKRMPVIDVSGFELYLIKKGSGSGSFATPSEILSASLVTKTVPIKRSAKRASLVQNLAKLEWRGTEVLHVFEKGRWARETVYMDSIAVERNEAMYVKKASGRSGYEFEHFTALCKAKQVIIELKGEFYLLSTASILIDPDLYGRYKENAELRKTAANTMTKMKENGKAKKPNKNVRFKGLKKNKMQSYSRRVFGARQGMREQYVDEDEYWFDNYDSLKAKWLKRLRAFENFE